MPMGSGEIYIRLLGRRWPTRELHSAFSSAGVELLEQEVLKMGAYYCTV